MAKGSLWIAWALLSFDMKGENVQLKFEQHRNWLRGWGLFGWCDTAWFHRVCMLTAKWVTPFLDNLNWHKFSTCRAVTSLCDDPRQSHFPLKIPLHIIFNKLRFYFSTKMQTQIFKVARSKKRERRKELLRLGEISICIHDTGHLSDIMPFLT